ncbi:uncharacterized protein A4U43_C04F5400 [Asparagus officinalis]|uniref:Response regulatory domain-containing protein n=1 Tax=Asparagus officinalis TaxID=4686 RepID=A0A5P1F2Y6_ASPOF|nr:uncharacterized protein A4U43_C04F5400 [Asparagus officinalis]
MDMSSVRGGGSLTGGEPNGDVHVLAVDDSSVDRAVIVHILRSSKYRVTAVDSGKRALEMLSTEPNVNMIITDYFMPEMTGFELLKKIKGSSLLKQIPVVVMSSENIPHNIHRCLEEGAEDFLLKPVVLELQDDGKLATSDYPPVVLGCTDARNDARDLLVVQGAVVLLPYHGIHEILRLVARQKVDQLPRLPQAILEAPILLQIAQPRTSKALLRESFQLLQVTVHASDRAEGEPLHIFTQESRDDGIRDVVKGAGDELIQSLQGENLLSRRQQGVEVVRRRCRGCSAEVCRGGRRQIELGYSKPKASIDAEGTIQCALISNSLSMASLKEHIDLYPHDLLHG